MMCPENTAPPKKIIDRIVALLDEKYLKHLIDDPIDAAVRQLQFTPEKAFSHRVFHRAISKLVGYIYEHTFQMKLHLSQPLDEAIFLLEQYYQNGLVRGYAAALLNAADEKRDGLDRVLTRLVEIIKAREREKYIYSGSTRRVISHGRRMA